MAEETNRIDSTFPPPLRAALLRVAQDPFATELGIALVAVRPGSSCVALTLEERHLNALGAAHGGIIFALADQAFALASNSRGQIAVGLSVSISYVAPALKGDRLLAEATEQHLGGRTGLYHMNVTTQSGKLIASCEGLVYRTQQPLGEAGEVRKEEGKQGD